MKPDGPNPTRPAAPAGADPRGSKIVHPKTQIGSPRDRPDRPISMEPAPVPVVESSGPVGSKITAFGKEKKHEEEWTRTPNTTGTGAIHVKTFHSKLTDDALTYMDRVINEWLDAHPQYEVKFVTCTVGTLTGKLKEPHLVCQVWV
jgi:hypothetical protein